MTPQSTLPWLRSLEAEGQYVPTDSVFRRGELPLAHTVYGLILTLATVGELMHLEVSAGASAGRTKVRQVGRRFDRSDEGSTAWLLAGSAVLLGAHLFSDALAHTATTRIGRLLSPLATQTFRSRGAVLVGALIMTVAAVADLDSNNALLGVGFVGLVVLALLCFYGLAHHRLLTRILMSVVAVGFVMIIVLLEYTL